MKGVTPVELPCQSTCLTCLQIILNISTLNAHEFRDRSDIHTPLPPFSAIILIYPTQWPRPSMSDLPHTLHPLFLGTVQIPQLMAFISLNSRPNPLKQLNQLLRPQLLHRLPREDTNTSCP